MNNLKQYENICNSLLIEFLNKQGISNSETDIHWVNDDIYSESEIHWVNDDIGQIVFINDFYFDFRDIITDLKYNAPKELIFDWYNDNLENQSKEINYYSYIKGLRIKDIKK
jgi:hypothetical protein